MRNIEVNADKIVAMMRFLQKEEYHIPLDGGYLPFPTSIPHNKVKAKVSFTFKLNGMIDYRGSDARQNSLVEIRDMVPERAYLSRAYLGLQSECRERAHKISLLNGLSSEQNRFLLFKFNNLDFLLS